MSAVTHPTSAVPFRFTATGTDDPVAVCIVTHDSAPDLPDCLRSVWALRHRPLELIVADCASRDESVRLVREELPGRLPTRILELHENLGFAGGMNRALAATRAPFILTLNPDSRPAPDFVDCLLARATGHPNLRVGAVTGRLVRPVSPGGQVLLDACGMRLTATWRHLDRGSGEEDRGQFMAAQRVFGATAAASLFRRQALDDIAIDGEVFAEEFHSYREDAELCFRLRERNWEVLYEPDARCEHRRLNLPSRRQRMPATVNYHSLKNRYLLRAYHQDVLNFMFTFPSTLWRDLLALAYVVLYERHSLSAYGWLWSRRQEIRARRRLLRKRRLASVNRWFFWQSLPL